MTIDCMRNLLFQERNVEDEDIEIKTADIWACGYTVIVIRTGGIRSEGKYVGAAVGYSYGTTSVDGFDAISEILGRNFMRQSRMRLLRSSA